MSHNWSFINLGKCGVPFNRGIGVNNMWRWVSGEGFDPNNLGECIIQCGGVCLHETAPQTSYIQVLKYLGRQEKALVIRLTA